MDFVSEAAVWVDMILEKGAEDGVVTLVLMSHHESCIDYRIRLRVPLRPINQNRWISRSCARRSDGTWSPEEVGWTVTQSMIRKDETGAITGINSVSSGLRHEDVGTEHVFSDIQRELERPEAIPYPAYSRMWRMGADYVNIDPELLGVYVRRLWG